MSIGQTCRFIGDSSVGLFGAGHLGRALAEALLAGGLPRQNIAICHRGSGETDRELAISGLTDLVTDKEEVVRRSRILLYLVRPQEYTAIHDCKLQDDCLLISFLAGIPLEKLPVRLPYTQRVRVMTSAPDTLRRQNGIAALYPADNAVTRELLESLNLRVVSLMHESDIHTFTALGPCLPIVLTFWEGLGHEINYSELLETVKKFDLFDYHEILEWAHSVRPRGLSDEERERYVAQATTPGGVTDAILSALRTGKSLSTALEQGIERSLELAAT